jgi:predicted MPP superfamily phosphohydrolase
LKLFFIIVLLIWTLMHVYVLHRMGQAPFISHHVPSWALIAAGILLGSSYISARFMERAGLGGISHVLEYVGANWIGILFLMLVSFFAADLISLFGFALKAHVSTLRTISLVVAIGLIVISFTQAWRTPVVTEYEVAMPGLPREADGTVMIVASDMHMGSMLGHRWATARARQFASLKPDFIVLAGDIFEAEEATHAGWLPVLQQFRAPKGVFIVTGNHELYAGPEPIIEEFKRAGFNVLRDESSEVLPGLVIAGVDDIAFRRRDKNAAVEAVDRALASRPDGATIFISHTPIYQERAAELGANLMLSGHTHNGQIWPFTYIVRIVFPLINGRYNVNGMTAITGRGTGTWGPRMRLWKRSELLRITLRAA